MSDRTTTEARSKTPQFDAALEQYFVELEPQLDEQGGQWRECRFSKRQFYVRPEDVAFYKKIGVPLPTLSPNERARRKFGYFNIYNLFRVNSTHSNKSIIAAYPPNTPYPIYEHEVWNGEGWNPHEFAHDYDPNRDFFSQYQDFQRSVPRANLNIKNSVGSDFTNNTSRVKNCYLVFDAIESEECAYCIYLEQSKYCYNGFGPINSEITYEAVISERLYRSFFIEYSRDCLDSSFLYDCRDCQYCFACTNLRHRKYCFLNEQLTKEEYEKRVSEIDLGNRAVVEEWKGKFSELKEGAIHRANHNEKSVDSSGDFIEQSRNCYSCYYVTESENIAYSTGGLKNRDSYDTVGGKGTELSYEVWGLSAYNTKFSMEADQLRDCEYCDLCENSNNCFACIGLRNRSFCIFNKQYSEEEYWKTVDEIKANMLAAGEYGEFFPPELAPIPYNVSLAMSYQGYDDIQTAVQYGYHAEEIPESIQDVSGEGIDAEDVPLDIKETGDDILAKVIFDRENNKQFRYTKQELDFHRQYNLALPIEHYSVHLARRRIDLGPIDFNIKGRECSKCGKATQVTIPENHPSAPKIVYCESCYNAEIH
ncbi:hypothetical protein KC727_02165 [Candidatus Kaiserbacteria bacterium]|nr:hypothetical protein [Candidatus Kaiserbacteria bacterium]